MNKGVTRCSLAALTALCMGAVAPARAVDVKAGNWDLSFTGNVNAFATYTRCGVANDAVAGAIACTKAENAPNTFAIESGLLPSAFVFTAKTRAYDLDVSATIGLYPGIHVADTPSGRGPGTGAGDFTLDVRQNFITFGDASWGTIKLGKDLGLFGADAILSDMTLLGVGAGTAGQTVRNHNVTIGHIGSGYIYADWIPQIAYISPSFGGLQITVAAIEAVQMQTDLGGTLGAVTNETPGVQGKVTYDLAGGMGRVWAGGMYQNTKLSDALSMNSYGGELGIKVNASGLGAMLYGYYGKGLGTILLGTLAGAGPNAAGDSIEARTTNGWFAQVTYQIPNTKFRPGLSWGMSYLGQAGVGANADPDVLVHWNGMGTAALFYAATDTLTLVAEFDHVRSKNHLDGLAKTNSAALGAIMFF
jgi:predicted porin